MEKLVVGRRARGVIDIEMPVEWNLRRIAKAETLHPRDLVVVILDRPRNQEIIHQVRDVGARIRLISDGDVPGALMAALETKTGMHVLMGSGGATEGVIAACAVKALGGDMQGRLLLKDAEDRAKAAAEGYKEGTVLGIDDLCSGRNVFFASTGITHGDLLEGVRYDEHYAFTHSMVLRSQSGTMRFVEGYHDMNNLRAKGLTPEQVVLSVLV
jgi:fructose-1,6-bisphosphatase II